ncbi:Translin-associated protein X [Armadillidium nasatum]|uniref:Translin-associated protein X n=1 Tax=Armadillidium nasatum TaxID=96803 RepID=A0A5N5THH4_9CRUS|nr:Translin-associated protein X [Armadillidium nasatum]
MSALCIHFKELSKLLDEKNDKYERIYKTNRDVTQKCKKIIFALQRIPGLEEEETKSIMKVSANEFRDIEQTLLRYIAMELKDGDKYQFLNAYTAGIQEYVEALTFYHFLLNEKILSHSEVQNRKTDPEELILCVPIPAKEYILGLGDLTGELMRFCIKSLSVGNYTMCYKICDILRHFNSGFMSLGYISSKELYHKTFVLKSTLAKVEEACYSFAAKEIGTTSGNVGYSSYRNGSRRWNLVIKIKLNLQAFYFSFQKLLQFHH